MKKIGALALLAFFSISSFAREAIYLEFKVTGKSMTGNTKTYSSGGDIRTEMTMKMENSDNEFSSASLLLHNSPGKAYTLNEKDKSYKEVDATKELDTEEEEYQVKVLGKEKINNYNCVHISVFYKKSKQSTEMWLSKEIPGYENYTGVRTKYLGGAKFFKALKDQGAEGFVVRMFSSTDNGFRMQMDLVVAEKREVAESLFSLKGYSNCTSPIRGGQRPNAEELQKMTPEERKAYMEKMKDKYKQPEQQH
jgi:Domain of unknown function (DUF4412)